LVADVVYAPRAEGQAKNIHSGYNFNGAKETTSKRGGTLLNMSLINKNDAKE